LKEKNLRKMDCLTNKYGFDIIINNAGIFELKDILLVSECDFWKSMKINVEVPFQICKYFIPHMISRMEGKIINIGSSSCYSGSSETGVYSVSKHALLGLTRSLLERVKKYNIQVSNISPGSMKTSMGKLDIRQDYNTFLDVEKVSNFIINLLSIDGNFLIDEIRINRMILK